MHNQSQVEQSFYIIKPEVFPIRENIHRYLVWKSGLHIAHWRNDVLTEKDIDTIFIDDQRTPLSSAIKQHLLHKHIETGIVEGQNAIHKLIESCGTKPYDGDCVPGTVRWVFGLRQSVWYSGVEYYLNAIHKASLSEARIGVDWFYAKYQI